MLLDPKFTQIDPQVNQDEIDNVIKQMLDLPTLYRNTPENLWSKIIGYIYELVLLQVQYTGEQNLVNFAIEQNLDQVGALLDVTRLPESFAGCGFRAVLSAPQTFNVFIPQGTRIRTVDGNYLFELSQGAIIPAGAIQTSIDIPGVCQIAGEAANDYAPGEISEIVDPIPFVEEIFNTEISSGGAATESDERFRERIKVAPGKLSVAGPIAAYIYWTLTASQTIVDVAVDSNQGAVELRDLVNQYAATYFPLFLDIVGQADIEPDNAIFGAYVRAAISAINTPANVLAELSDWELKHTAPQYGRVNLYVLSETGLPNAALKNLIKTTVDPYRPFTDDVQVPTPVIVNFSLEIEFKTFTREAKNVTQITTNVEMAAVNYLKDIGAKLPTAYAQFESKHYRLGIDIILSQIIQAIQDIAGVYDVTIISPVESIVLEANEWSNCDNLTVTWTGQEVG